MSHLETSYFVFSIVLMSLFLIPLRYRYLNERKMYLIERKSVLSDPTIIFVCLLYALLLGFRYDYAYDWMQYHDTFEYLKRDRLYRQNTELGYLAINWMLGRLGFNYYSIFLLEGFFWIYWICYFFRHDRKSLFLILPIVFMATRFRCLNLSRQHFAMSVFFIAFSQLLDGKKKNYLVLSLIASTIHASVVLFVVPFYFCDRIKIPPLKVTLVLYLIAFLLHSFLLDNLLRLGDYANIFVANKDYDTSTLLADRFIFEEKTLRQSLIGAAKDVILICSLYYYLGQQANKGTKYLSVFAIGIYGIIFKVMASGNEITSRTFLYMVIPAYACYGLVCSYLYENRRSSPKMLIIGGIFFILHHIYAMYAQIAQEYMIDIYLEYKF